MQHFHAALILNSQRRVITEKQYLKFYINKLSRCATACARRLSPPDAINIVRDPIRVRPGKNVTRMTRPGFNLVSRARPIFGAGRYRLQYKRPRQKYTVWHTFNTKLVLSSHAYGGPIGRAMRHAPYYMSDETIN